MVRIFLVIAGIFYFGIVRGWKFSFEGRLNFLKPMMKKQGVPFYRTGSPFDKKKSNFWPMLYPLILQLGGNFQKKWVHWASRLRGVITSSHLKEFSAISPPRSLQR
jgi:hypothetical protein